MSNYTKSTNFATKDNLTPGDPLKVVRGTEIDTEYNDIATAIATKTDGAASSTDNAIARFDSTTGKIIQNSVVTIADTTGDIVGTATQGVFNTVSTTVNAFGAATTVNLGAATGTATVNNTTLAAKAITASATLAVTGAATLSSTLAVTGTSTLTGAVTATAGVTGPITSSSVSITGGSITGITDLAVADGGTGASTANNALNNLLPSQTGNANKYLQTDGTNSTWDAVSLSTADITGTLGVANGGTGVTTSTGTTNVVLSNSPTLVTPILGTPTSATLTNATGLPISTGVSGLGTGVATFLGTPSSANLAAAVTDETGSGALVFANTPTLVTPILGTPTSATLTNATGLPLTTGVTGTLPTANGGTNLTSFTSGGVVYASSSSVLATGSGLTFDGSNLSTTGQILINNNNYVGFKNTSGSPSVSIFNDTSNFLNFYNSGNTGTIFYVNAAEQMRLTSTGLGIGTSSPSGKLHASTTGPVISTLESSAANGGYLTFSNSSTVPLYIGFGSTLTTGLSTSDAAFRYSNNLVFSSGATEVGRFTSGGNLLVGTTANANSAKLKSKVSGGSVGFEVTDEASSDFVVVPASSSGVCKIGPTAGAMSFQSAGTERARITSGGDFYIGATVNVFSTTTTGINLFQNGNANYSTNGANVLYLNRNTDDGDLVLFYQALTQEGSISVSGTTVSYNGGHLSRYAQTTTAKDESIVKGTVLSNLDEMSVYTKDGQPVANEQLNKVKVSDTEGDVNVAGVFVNWSHDKDHNVDEINMAMTGDMIIRIAQGVTVVRGDLLMSAGDGTAKPQGDDIIRSKTVAKVTSNHVTCTYADGSYCVPCVLMAC